MQSVAAELQHAETAFVKPSPGGDAEWELRWFTPTIEVDLCGHATLATTHALLSDGLASGKVGFLTRSGVLTASVDDGWITLDFPVNRPVEAEAPAGLIAALGVEPVSVHSTGALTDVFVVLPDESALRALAPDLGQVKAINQRERNRGTIVTAPRTPASISCRGSSLRPPGSRRTRSVAARTPRWRRTGPSASDGTNWSDSRRPPEAVSSASPPSAIAST